MFYGKTFTVWTGLKGGFVSKLWPNKVINYKYLFLNLVKNPPLTVNKQQLKFLLIQDYQNQALNK